jgi:hypothetical protein
MMMGRKSDKAVISPHLTLAEHAWFRLRLWCVERPPFVAAMTAPARLELRDLCREMAEALDAVLGKE